MKNLDNRVKCIKIYTNGKSEEIQQKLFELGVKWASGSTGIMHPERPFLYVDENRFLWHGSSMIDFKQYEYKEVNYLDILSWEAEPECQLRPFQKVLVRDYDSDDWLISFFAHTIDYFGQDKYRCLNGVWRHCIPYRGNQHLLGTNDSPHKEAGN